jgi:hypothetical protein
LRDDKGTVRYFLGCQCDITGLVIQGMGIKSFRALLQQYQQKDFETQPHGSDKKSWLPSRNKESLLELQELSIMFSQDESDVVNRNSRGADDSDAGSMKSK